MSSSSTQNYSQGLSSSDEPIDVPIKISQCEFAPLCSSEPLMILTIKLASIPAKGLPPNLVYENTYNYLPGCIKHICISFDFSTSNGLDAYKTRINELVNKLQSGDLTRYPYLSFYGLSLTTAVSFHRFAVFLINHTDPERGDLHFAPNNMGASPISKVFLMPGMLY